MAVCLDSSCHRQLDHSKLLQLSRILAALVVRGASFPIQGFLWSLVVEGTGIFAFG